MRTWYHVHYLVFIYESEYAEEFILLCNKKILGIHKTHIQIDNTYSWIL